MMDVAGLAEEPGNALEHKRNYQNIPKSPEEYCVCT